MVQKRNPKARSKLPEAGSPVSPELGVGEPTWREWLALTVLSLGLGVIVLDGTIVGVALPTIIADLGMDLADAQWVNSLYAVVLAALLLSTGSIADKFGRRRLFAIGLVVFVAGSVFAALATSSGHLISSRALQALGAAMIMPSTLSTVNVLFQGRARAAAFGVWGAVISGAAALGPLAGGALTQWISWRWIFLVNVPIGAVLLIATFLVIPETRGKDLPPGMDYIGVLLNGLGFGALVFAIIEGPSVGWWKPTEAMNLFGLHWGESAAVSVVPIAGALAVVFLVGFFFWEKNRAAQGKSAVLSLALFRLPTFSWGNVTAAMVAIGEFAILFVLPLFLINALGLEVMATGTILAAMALGAFFSGASARHLAARLGAPGVVVLGLVLELVGIVLLAAILSPTGAGWMVAPPLVIYGLGLGLASAQLTGTVLRDVPLSQSGQASATQSTVRQVGTAMGTAFAGATLAMTLMLSVPSSLEGVGITGEMASDLATATRVSAGTNIAAMRNGLAAGDAQAAEVLEALTAGFTDATRFALLIGSLFLLLGLVGAMRLRKAASLPVEQK